MSRLRYNKYKFHREDSSKYKESVVFDSAVESFYSVTKLVAKESSKAPELQSPIKVCDKDKGLKYFITYNDNERAVTIVVKDLTEDEKRMVKS